MREEVRNRIIAALKRQPKIHQNDDNLGLLIELLRCRMRDSGLTVREAIEQFEELDGCGWCPGCLAYAEVVRELETGA